MGGYLNDWDTGSEGDDTGAEFQPEDPLERLNKRDQDIFFRLLDLIPDDKREAAMEFFYDHPAKIVAIVEHIKAKKGLKQEIVKDKNPARLAEVLAEENVSLDDLSTPAGTEDEDQRLKDETEDDWS